MKNLKKNKKFLLNFIKNNNCGIMFHHFKNSQKKSFFKGSISSNDLEKIILKIGLKNIATPDDFIKNLNKRNKKNLCCLTFDDGLKSQIEIALPVLKKYNLKAFWFIYTSIFEKDANDNEVNKYLINKHYPNFNLFLKILKKKMKLLFPNLKYKFKFSHDNHLKYLTSQEREFRYIRDKLLSDKEYLKLISLIMKKKNKKKLLLKKKIFFNTKDIKKLVRGKHEIGMHSHSHPMNMTKLSYKKQKKDFLKCYKKLKALTEHKPICMSHPNNFYNKDTLKVLRKMSIKIGFNSQKYTRSKSTLEIPRVDCAYLR